MMITTRFPWVVALMLVTVAPAVADPAADLHCSTMASMMRAYAKLCGAAGGVIPGAAARKCLLSHASDFGETATACVNAAESHYDASSTLQGYDADRELLSSATYLGNAAEANIYYDRRDLAAAQLKSVIKIASQVKADPQAGSFKSAAASELAAAKNILSAIGSAS
jgi:hypothetical protein